MSKLPSLLLLAVALALFGSAHAAPTPRVMKDCTFCPELVSLPGGSFQMGSAATEPGRYPNEGPQTLVSVAAFAIGRTEVTRSQFAAFVTDTGHPMSGGCYTPGDLADLLSDLDPAAFWREPGFEQNEAHPVVCVSWDDAVAYAAWLTRKTGHNYRLPTEAEWEYAARAGTTTAYYWGEDGARECAHVNGGDLTLGRQLPAWALATRKAREGGLPQSVLIDCEDGSAFTAAAGSYKPNAFGLHDMAGNVWEWVVACGDAPGLTEDSAVPAPNCKRRRTRGGSWGDWPIDLRSAVRKRLEPDRRRNDTGFRIVRVS